MSKRVSGRRSVFIRRFGKAALRLPVETAHVGVRLWRFLGAQTDPKMLKGREGCGRILTFAGNQNQPILLGYHNVFCIFDEIGADQPTLSGPGRLLVRLG
jgi:hypothetical protein